MSIELLLAFITMLTVTGWLADGTLSGTGRNDVARWAHDVKQCKCSDFAELIERR